MQIIALLHLQNLHLFILVEWLNCAYTRICALIKNKMVQLSMLFSGECIYEPFHLISPMYEYRPAEI